MEITVPYISFRQLVEDFATYATAAVVLVSTSKRLSGRAEGDEGDLPKEHLDAIKSLARIGSDLLK